MALLLAVALVVRVFFWVALGRALDSADAVQYVEMATQFAAGDFRSFDPRIPILYSALCAGASLAFPDIETACRMVSLLCSVLTLLPVYWLSRALHGVPAARIAALVTATWPWLADYGSRVAPESLALLLWFTTVYLLAEGLLRRAAYLPFAALTIFGLYLARPEGVLTLLAAPLGGVLLVAGRPNKGAAFIRLGLFVAMAAALVVAAVLVMRSLTGHAALSYRAASVAASAHYLTSRAVELGKTFSKVFTEVIPIMLGPLLLMFAGVGAFQKSERPRDFRLEIYVLFFAAVQFTAAVLSTYPEPRYAMAVIVALMLWAARGMALVSRQARDNGYGGAVASAPVTTMLALMAFGAATVFVPEWMGRIPRDPIEYKLAGVWMKQHLEPGLILTRKPQVGYYAGMKSFGPSAHATVESVTTEAEAAGARYLVLDERYTASMAPGLKPLLDAKRPAPAGLKLVTDSVSPYPGASVVIYEFTQAPRTPSVSGTQ
ncbi:MAG: glycosyltransferase family 39 protein [Candidatus Hydrogenedentes bacterium]|nr:glycosyltransferase family 39 protein [Candidatus Hydrogenedentota bacterium]